MKRLLITLFCAAALAACKSTPMAEVPITDAKTGVSADSGARPDQVVRVEPTPGGDDPTMVGILRERSVYFDLDSFVIKEEYRQLVTAHSDFLKKNPQRKVTIEGNTDERGSREYNLALGQKRSEAVKSMMRVLGVPENQLEAVSFGEERPKEPGHDEAAWAKNRRADISYRAP